MQPLLLTLKGFLGLRDGLGRDEIRLDLERRAAGYLRLGWPARRAAPLVSGPS